MAALGRAGAARAREPVSQSSEEPSPGTAGAAGALGGPGASADKCSLCHPLLAAPAAPAAPCNQCWTWLRRALEPERQTPAGRSRCGGCGSASSAPRCYPPGSLQNELNPPRPASADKGMRTGVPAHRAGSHRAPPKASQPCKAPGLRMWAVVPPHGQAHVLPAGPCSILTPQR